ncbi:MAG: hypothetical protein JM58_04120 [Peptococcaceae bacterium BICA1-8]|nr:MAG: hypothetical protein JM58_04120 [Peptococcaceae bacterium BICA1-8]
MKDIVFWSLVQRIWGIKGNKILSNLMRELSGTDFWDISPIQLQRDLTLIPQQMASLFLTERKRVNIEYEYLKLNKHNVKIIGLYDSNYPKRLKNIFDPPPLLYVRGNFTETNLAIAVVGARKASAYGKKTALKLTGDLSKNGIQIISGLARGIDACSHQAALEGTGGTIAVLGSGVDIVYPRENLRLFNEIIISEKSAVISEFPLGTEPMKHYFPMRNRIISGLADGILVIEAREKSGSLITAELGLEQGKDVFAVPGPIDSALYKGSHRLIKDGAKLIDDVEDIFEEFGQLSLFKGEPINITNLDSAEKIILAVLTSEPSTIEQIIINSKLPTKEVLRLLSLLEIKGYIKQVIGRKYISLNWGD